MEIYTQEDLHDAVHTIEPTISQLLKMEPKFQEGTSQHTLLIRRIRAFNIGTALIKRELRHEPIAEYAEDMLKEALQAIRSTINKSVKIPSKLKEGTANHTLLLRRIKAFQIAALLIEREMEG